MSPTLNRKSWREVPTCERVHGSQSAAFRDQLCNFVGCLFNLANGFFRIFRGMSYDHRRRVVLGAKVVMSVGKIADDLVVVKTSRDSWSRLWPREQSHVIADSIGTIDDRSVPVARFACNLRAAYLGTQSVVFASTVVKAPPFKRFGNAIRRESPCSKAQVALLAAVVRVGLRGSRLAIADGGQQASVPGLLPLSRIRLALESSFRQRGCAQSVSAIPGSPAVQKTPCFGRSQLYEKQLHSRVISGVLKTHDFRTGAIG